VAPVFAVRVTQPVGSRRVLVAALALPKEPADRPIKSRPLTNAQKLAKALTNEQKLAAPLRVCAKKRSKATSASCQRQARKRYGAKAAVRHRIVHAAHTFSLNETGSPRRTRSTW
jgi:hypothetical protein